MKIEYYFWLSSDWSFLGHGRLHDLASYHGAEIVYRPLRHAGLFAATGGQLLSARSPQRQAYREAELGRWCERLAFPLNLNPRWFPVDNERALRVVAGAILSASPEVGNLVEGFMRAVWQQDADIADPDTVAAIAARHGIPADAAERFLHAPETADLLERNVARAAEAGVFGAPSYVLEGEVFWGQDRLSFLAESLRQRT